MNREPPNANAQNSAACFGIAVGIDGPLDNGALFASRRVPGLGSGRAGSGRRRDFLLFGQGAYLGTAMGPVDLDFIGAGFGQMPAPLHRHRFELQRTDGRQWWATKATARRALAAAGARRAFHAHAEGEPHLRGAARAELHEEGGGAAFDLEADSRPRSGWADAGVEFARAGGCAAAAWSRRASMPAIASAIDESRAHVPLRLRRDRLHLDRRAAGRRRPLSASASTPPAATRRCRRLRGRVRRPDRAAQPERGIRFRF